MIIGLDQHDDQLDDDDLGDDEQDFLNLGNNFDVAGGPDVQLEF